MLPEHFNHNQFGRCVAKSGIVARLTATMTTKVCRGAFEIG